MKKSLKKLTLHRETLSALDSEPLGRVVGGLPTYINCAPTYSCDGTCGACASIRTGCC